MKKEFFATVLLGLAMRLAVLAGAGEAISGAVNRLTDAFPAPAPAEAAVEATLPPETETEEAVLSGGEGARAETRLIAVTPAPKAETPVETPEPEKTVVAATLSSASGIQNDTDFVIDQEALAAEGLSLRLDPDGPQILIVHTHGSEAYTQCAGEEYEESDPYRTEDLSRNIIRVGDELADKLTALGLNVIHDRGIYDYPSYTGSYNRSGAAVEEYLAQYPDIGIVIDLHRDALGSGDTVYKTRSEIQGKCASQVMLLVGTGENGLYHPNWRENLKLAMYMQSAMDENYPTLARPIELKPERYNQHLTTGSLILEVGSSGNTLSEALCAIDLFADSVGPALLELVDGGV